MMSLYCRNCGGTSYYISGKCSGCGQPMYKKETGEMVQYQQELFPHLPKQDPDFRYKKVYGPEASTESDAPVDDPVEHPKHYTQHPSGVECIDITEHFMGNLANAVKYIWRAGLKGDAIEDLKKAAWYVNREIQRQEKIKNG